MQDEIFFHSPNFLNLSFITVDPNAKDRYEVTPLHLAAEYGSTKCIKRLLEAGANINAKTRYLKDYQQLQLKQKVGSGGMYCLLLLG